MTDLSALTLPEDSILRWNAEIDAAKVARCDGDGIYPHNAENPFECPTCGHYAWQHALITEVLRLRESARKAAQ